MPEALTFQEIILALHRYWAERGCLIWQPHNVQVGAGTMNPATVLRVLGPEPWNVAYVEPSVRPDDSRYGENPNRFQQHTQYQVILKPDPGDPQELYLDSLAAIGIDQSRHDIRFVEDNWESPALGAWGLGWEVWLDGLEITQFTYFQQAGGFMLDPVSVELTYGLERIAMFLQGVDHFKKIRYAPGISYGEMFGSAEYEHSRYNLDDADITAQAELFRLYEREARHCIDLGLVLPAHDFVLKCSHTFNVLDARGAIGVTERAKFFSTMRGLFREVSQAYLEQRQGLGYPLLPEAAPDIPRAILVGGGLALDDAAHTFVLEVGTEELPAGDVNAAIQQLQAAVPTLLARLHVDHGPVRVLGSPRRLVVWAEAVASRQCDEVELIKGPPARVAFDEHGAPTQAALGFARSRGLDVHSLEIREMDGGRYAVGLVRRIGQPTAEALAEALPELIAGTTFQKSMRWNAGGFTFSRPIRWLLALLGNELIPFSCAGVVSGRTSRGSRSASAPVLPVESAEVFLDVLSQANITVDPQARRAAILEQIAALAADVDGWIPDDPGLLEEVTNLVEQPTALLGRFDPAYLKLPRDVLVTVMRKHQRYFPVVDKQTDRLLPCFVAVRNGDHTHIDVVRRGNEEVLRARFADAEFFWKADTSKKLADWMPRLQTLTFQEQLGSMLDKTRRLEALVPQLCRLLGLSEKEMQIAERAAHLCKADLVTQMVTDFTSLQGIMGREYALLSGENEAVAQAIFEHYLPRYAGDAVPSTRTGLVVGLANRLDSLTGLFAAGLAPSGSTDPYHLRRDALGLVHNLIAHRQPFSIAEGLSLTARLMPIVVSDSMLEDTATFVRERLRGVLRDEGFAFDVVDAVLAGQRGDDPFRARAAVEALAQWVSHEDWPQLLAAYSRCVRILRTYPESVNAQALVPERLYEPASRALFAAYQQVGARVSPQSSVDELLGALQTLVEPITTFFDQVLVMAEDKALRINRLALLQSIAALTEGQVDLSRLQGF